MRWYQGDISQAVTASKQNGSVFVVYVEGKNGSSQDLTNLINDTKTCELLETNYFVAIKIEMDSVSHQQFSQIYKEATVPSIFFIGKSGSPLEVVKESTDSSEFLVKLWAVLDKHGVDKSAVLETLKQAGSSTNSEVVCEDNACRIKQPDESSSSSGTSENNLSAEEKLDRAKEILAKKREAKRLEEEETQRLKELERRKAGQNVQNLKRWQQDNEMKELLEERNKEKKEKQEAKKRVLDQIAQDRLERASKFANVSATQNPSETIPSTSQVTHRVVNSNVARLQFKLPDGSSHTHEFSSSSTLEEAVDSTIIEMQTDNNCVLSPSKKRTPENLRTQGNVHRLSDSLSDSDDDNNTWNGNSTQQM